MNENSLISRELMEQWEREAIEQNIPCTEFGNFLRMKERNFRQSDRKKKDSSLKVADGLEMFLKIPVVERTCTLARYDMETLRKRAAKGFVSDEQKENFLCARECWFSHLKERMRDLRISKETMESFGLSWKSCKELAYMNV